MPQDTKLAIILQRILPHYRIPFFARLNDSLARQGIRLRVIYGQELPGSVPVTIHPDCEWAEYAENKYWRAGDTEVVWQGCLAKLSSPDLVIMEQANRLLVNYYLLLRRAATGLRVAYWGHGRNLQGGNASSLRERLKRRLSGSVDWWFAYTRMSADLVTEAGFSADRITVVENTIDTGELAAAMTAVTAGRVEELREQFGVGEGPVALFCGGMYPHKRLPFLISAVVSLRERIPDLHVVLIGGGPDAGIAEEAAANHTWIHYAGPVFGVERATYFAMADVMLMPGLVGLAIIDCFVAGLPIVTTDVPIHSPEIAYLEHGVNGLMTRDSLDDYVRVVQECLTGPALLASLREGSRRSAARYTLENMVNNFTAGVLSALDESRK